MTTLQNAAALNAAFGAQCPSMDWRISAAVLGAFVMVAGLVWHICSVRKGGPLDLAGGGVLLGFFVLFFVAVGVLGGTHQQALDERTGLPTTDDGWAASAFTIGTLVTVLIAITFSITWWRWSKDKKGIDLVWPITYTIIFAIAIALNIGLPVALDREGCLKPDGPAHKAAKAAAAKAAADKATHDCAKEAAAAKAAAAATVAAPGASAPAAARAAAAKAFHRMAAAHSA